MNRKKEGTTLFTLVETRFFVTLGKTDCFFSSKTMVIELIKRFSLYVYKDRDTYIA